MGHQLRVLFVALIAPTLGCGIDHLDLSGPFPDCVTPCQTVGATRCADSACSPVGGGSYQVCQAGDGEFPQRWVQIQCDRAFTCPGPNTVCRSGYCQCGS